jgi:serine/threonine-protein kinase
MDIKKARSATKAAMVCGIISSAITLIIAAIAIYKGHLDIAGIQANALMLIDFGVVVGLTIGLAFKSRVCAVLMLTYFSLSKWMQWSRDLNPGSIITGVIFLYFYVQGVRGTFAYHKAKKEEANQALVPTPASVTPAAGAPVAPDAGAAHL